MVEGGSVEARAAMINGARLGREAPLVGSSA